MNKKIIIALFGAAGSGKDTIQKEIARQSPFLFHEIISSTTRPPREYEQNGIDYEFISVEESNRYLEHDEYLEYAEFRGWRYGTLKYTIREDKINIGVFNLSGVKQLLKLSKEEYLICPIYIQASDKVRLLRQLNREENPDCTEICRRFNTDKEDLADKNIDFWYCSVWNDSECSVQALVESQLLPHLYEILLLECIQGGYLCPNKDGILYSSPALDTIRAE